MKATRQHLGGLASFEGNAWEHYFSVYRVLLALEALRSGTRRRVAFQLANCRVDDWAEAERGLRTHFQLRRRKVQHWSDVRDAFVAQLKSRSCRVVWVVADKLQAEKLRLSTHRLSSVEVHAFPRWLEPQSHVTLNGPVHVALVANCVVTPTSSDLEAIWKDVAWTWENTRRPGHFVHALTIARRLDETSQAPLLVAPARCGQARHRTSRCRFGPPPPLRSFWRRPRWWAPAEQILSNIRGFTFSLVDGHFFYRGQAGFEGRFSCRINAFRDFARRVVTHKPRRLHDVQELL